MSYRAGGFSTLIFFFTTGINWCFVIGSLDVIGRKLVVFFLCRHRLRFFIPGGVVKGELWCQMDLGYNCL